MSTLHDLMASSIDGLARELVDATPATEARVLIGRRRRRNAVVTGGTSALAVGGLVAAGLTHTTRANDSDPASGSLEAIAYATIPAVTEFGPDGSLVVDHRVGCGDTVPGSSASLDGLSLRTELFMGAEPKSVEAISLDANTSVVSTLTYQGAAHSPVFIDVGYGVLTKDGVVIATVEQSVPRTKLRFDPLIDGSSWNDVANLGRLMLCNGSSSAAGGDTAIAIGDYEFFTFAQAGVTEQAIGLDVLLGDGYGPAQPSGAWEPGSIDCANAIESRDAELPPGVPPVAIPLACEPNAVPGAVIDADAGTITVPYPASDYKEDVAVTLVSAAMPIHLDQALPYSGLGGWISHDGPAINPDE